jgi:hypothetical protein
MSANSYSSKTIAIKIPADVLSLGQGSVLEIGDLVLIFIWKRE